MLTIFVLFCSLVISTLAFAILPENIGGTQYGVGYVAASNKIPKDLKVISTELGWTEIKYDMYLHKIEQIMLSRHDEVHNILKNSTFSTEHRAEFLDVLARLQEMERKNKPKLFMLGPERAVATDGHHRVRNMVKLTEAMESSAKLWPDEVLNVLSKYQRIDKSGKMVLSLSLIDPIVVMNLPANTDAATLMRNILIHRAGLWSDPADVALAKKYMGTKNIDKITKKELRYLASKLGIVDGVNGVTFTPVTELPDYSLRTLVGDFFAKKKIKGKPAAFKDYVEFYVGDEIKKYVAKNPAKYPALAKIVNPQTSIAEQRALMQSASLELERLYAVKKGIYEKTLDLTIKGRPEVEASLERIRYMYCLDNQVSSNKCADYIASLSKTDKKVLTKRVDLFHNPPVKIKGCNPIRAALQSLR